MAPPFGLENGDHPLQLSEDDRRPPHAAEVHLVEQLRDCGRFVLVFVANHLRIGASDRSGVRGSSASHNAGFVDGHLCEYQQIT